MIRAFIVESEALFLMADPRDPTGMRMPLLLKRIRIIFPLVLPHRHAERVLE